MISGTAKKAIHAVAVTDPPLWRRRLNMAHFRQLRDEATGTFSYLLACEDSGGALVIDPVVNQTPLYLGILTELGLRLDWVLETHLHADHISAADSLREWTDAKVAVGSGSGILCANRMLRDGACLFDSVVRRLFAYPDETLVYPGHCLSGRRVSSIGEERKSNPHFHGVSRDSFASVTIDAGLPGTLPIDLEANRHCGRLIRAQAA